MKQLLSILLAVTFVALAPTFVEAGVVEQEWTIEDSPVPLDGNYVQYRLLLDVPSPTTCDARLVTEFFNVELLFSSRGAVADLSIGGVESQSICSLSAEQGDACTTVQAMQFDADGQYEVVFTVTSVEISEIGNHWDEEGSNPGLDPDTFTSGLHHSTTLTQNCGDIIAWEVVVADGGGQAGK